MRKIPILAALLLGLLPAATVPAHAVSLREVISKCGDDGKRLCKGVRYGQPMQDCLVAKRDKASATCRPIIDRLKAGEKVKLF